MYNKELSGSQLRSIKSAKLLDTHYIREVSEKEKELEELEKEVAQLQK